MSKKGVVALGVQLDYKKTLDDMTRSFKTELDRIQEEFKDINFPDKLKNQISELSGKIDQVTDETKAKIDDLVSGKLDTKEFAEFQQEVSGNMQNIRREITLLKNDLENLQKQFKLTGGGKIATEIITEFKGVQETLKNTTKLVLDFYRVCSKNGIEINFDGISNASSDILKLRDAFTGLNDALTYAKYTFKDDLENGFDLSNIDTKELEKKMSEFQSMRNSLWSAYDSMSEEEQKSQFGKSLAYQIKALDAARYSLYEELSDRFDRTEDLSKFSPQQLNRWKKEFANIEKTVDAINKAKASVKDELADALNLGAEVATFQVKDGKIHVPVEIATREANLQQTLTDLIKNLNNTATKKPVVIPIALVSDYKTKNLEEARQQLANDDISGLQINVEKALENSLNTTLKGALNTATSVLKEIKEKFEKNPVYFPLKVNDEEFVKELGKAIDEGLKSIKNGEANHILDMTKTLEHLKKCLVELNQLAGNEIKVKGLENFDSKGLGLSEESLNRIVGAIREIEDVLRRVYNLPTASDIVDQWSKLEAKFKSFAKDSGKINLSKNKKDIKELLELYAEYIRLGGTDPIEKLSDNKDTIAKLTAQWEKYNAELTKANQQEKQITQQNKKEPVKKDKKYKDDSSVIDKESEYIEKLQGKIEDLENAIISKTDAIKQEQWQMEASAREEIFAIDGIIDKIIELKNQISSIKDIKVPEIRIAATQAVAEQVNEFEKMLRGWAEAERTIKNAGMPLPERNAYFNTDTGEISNPYIHGEVGRVVAELVQYGKNDVSEGNKGTIHTHSGDKYAAMSKADFVTAYNQTKNDGVRFHIAQAMEDMMVLDANKIEKKDLYKLLDFANEFEKTRSSAYNKHMQNYNASMDLFDDYMTNNPAQWSNWKQEYLKTVDLALAQVISRTGKNDSNPIHSSGIKNAIKLKINQALTDIWNQKSKGVFASDKSRFSTFVFDSIANVIDDSITNSKKYQNDNLYKDTATEAKDLLYKLLLRNEASLKSHVSKQDGRAVFTKFLQEHTLQLAKKYGIQDALTIKTIDEFIAEHPMMKGAVGSTQKPLNQSSALDTNIINSELESLDNLKLKVESVEQAFKDKTKAIEAEKDSMSQAAKSEVASLDKVLNKVKDLATEIKNIKNIKVPEIKVAVTQVNQRQINTVDQQIGNILQNENVHGTSNTNDIVTQIKTLLMACKQFNDNFERSAALNSQTGYTSQVLSGDREHEVSAKDHLDEQKKYQLYDTAFHTHPNMQYAVPSTVDFYPFAEWSEHGVYKQIIAANKEIGLLDLSNLSKETILKIREEYDRLLSTDVANKAMTYTFKNTMYDENSGYGYTKKTGKQAFIDSFVPQFYLHLNELKGFDVNQSDIENTFNKTIKDNLANSFKKIDLDTASLQSIYESVILTIRQSLEQQIKHTGLSNHNSESDIAKAIDEFTNYYSKNTLERLQALGIEHYYSQSSLKDVFDDRKSLLVQAMSNIGIKNAKKRYVSIDIDKLDKELPKYFKQSSFTSKNKNAALSTQQSSTTLPDQLSQKAFDFKQETESLNKLHEKINTVIRRIDAKTKAFEKEETVVKQVVSSEIAELTELANKISVIETSLKNLAG